ncbi:MAG: proline dehydrogenase family protein [Flavobacteriales bacterium]|nr:proline dehydrogenase family protein [Flavobacteriales bacterium]
MISFDNTEIAFRSKSNRDLKRAYWLFKAVGSSAFVKFGKWATNLAFKLRLPIKGMIRKTIFRQFCGGESVKGSMKTMNSLAEYNVKTILDYSIEGKFADEDFDATVAEIIQTIEAGGSNKNIPFAVFKMTGICLFDVLKNANEGIDRLTLEDQNRYETLVARVDRICATALQHNVPVFIDAEETWIQNTIDRIVQEMMARYNKNHVIVYNTLQMYRHDRLEYLKEEIDRAKKENYHLGVKLVRGAYMEKERERAEKHSYPSPIQPNKDACDADFNHALRLSLDNIDTVAVCAGTHNEESSMLLTQIMAEKELPNNHPSIYFAQLLGMSDHISFNLANAGYNVAKYVPFGPVKEVMPYLLRRAEENTSVAGQTSRELKLIMKEIKRRKGK